MEPNADGWFDEPPLDPKENADAGIEPNGEEPNDEAGFPEEEEVP